MALLLVVLGAATGSLRQPSRNRMHEVQDLREMMEKVRQQTEGGEGKKIPTVALPAKKEKLQSDEYFKGEYELDASLISQADQVVQVSGKLSAEDSGKQKKASLAKISATKESSATKAARYFAVHGMDKVAHMLGKEFQLSATAEVIEQHKVALAKFNAKAPTQIPRQSSEVEDFSDPDDDDAEVKEREHWAAVDSLKQRAAALGLGK